MKKWLIGSVITAATIFVSTVPAQADTIIYPSTPTPTPTTSQPVSTNK